MRKLFALIAAGALALALVSPAAAAPVQNPRMDQWEIVCGGSIGTITVTAKGVPGWPIDGGPGTTPILLRAASFYVWVEGSVVDGPFAWTPPPGLESRLVGPCLLHLAGGTTGTFDIRATDAMFSFPAG